ncbi:MAG: SDR family oxidoreductase [Acidimicrobiia bacterium]|nr:SDR family oxidoreductase [Acidimicrobiia bacterium]
MADLTGKVAVITGGSKGLGRAIAERLASDGADGIIAARTQADLEAAATAIARATGRTIETCAADLGTIEGCERLHEATRSVFDHVDILVNCAGATKAGPFLDLDDEAWADGFALKFFGAVRLCRLFWPQLVESRGTVINVSGGLARTPVPDIMIGGAVNAAFANFSKALAGLGLRDDVNVNVIHPGQTVTERFETLLATRAEAAGVSPEKFQEQITERQGVRRLGTPADVAAVAGFLCSPAARHVQGVAIAVDGGATKGMY